MLPILVAPPEDPAYAIWLRARSAVTSVAYPRRLNYVIAVCGRDGSMPAQDHYRGSYDSAIDRVSLFPISDEQLKKPPPVPHDFAFKWNFMGIPIGRPQEPADLLGEPLLSPTYMFGIRYRQGPRALQGQSGGSIPTIAIVSSKSPEYRVSLVDTPLLEDGPAYHLRMTPLRSPKTNRLRELWVGTADYLPRKAMLSGDFTTVPLADVPWTVDFMVSGGAAYVRRETTDHVLYLPHRRVVSDAVIEFQNVREPTGSIYDVPLVTPETDDVLMEPSQ